jgi:hypothetical protein
VGKPTVADCIQDLGRIKDIDAMLREGMPPVEIADFIQLTLREILHVERGTLADALRNRMKGLPPKELTDDEFPAAACPAALLGTNDGNDPPRSPGRLARSQYKKARKGLDTSIELESLYLYQRDRLDWMAGIENDEGTPSPFIADEIKVAQKLLATIADVKKSAGPAMARLGFSLEIGEMQEGSPGTVMQNNISRVMSNPASRHRILSLVDKFRRIGALPDHVADGVAEPVAKGNRE